MKKLTLHTRIHLLKCQSFGLGLLFALTKQRWFFERKIATGIVLLSLINLCSACDKKANKQQISPSQQGIRQEKICKVQKGLSKPMVMGTCYLHAPESYDSASIRSSNSRIHPKKSFVTEQQETFECIYIAEEMPQFPDGEVTTYINNHLIYPEAALEKRIEGRVITQFIVDSVGKISDVQVVRGVDPALDAEAVRVIRSMPKWKPAKQRNQPVRVKYTLPVKFKSTTEKK